MMVMETTVTHSASSDSSNGIKAAIYTSIGQPNATATLKDEVAGNLAVLVGC